MPDDQTTQTPQQTGTGGSQTPDSGTGQPTAADAAPVTPATDENSVEFWKQKFSASSRENQRVMQEGQQKDAMLQQQATQLTQFQQYYAANPPEQQQVQQPQEPDPIDLLLDRKNPEFRNWVVQQAVPLVKQELTQEARQQAGIQTSATFCDQALRANPELTTEAAQRYHQKFWSPEWGHLKNEESTLQGGVTYNPHKMREAIREVQDEKGLRTRQVQEAGRQQGEFFVEPQDKGATPPTGQFRDSMLTDIEHDMAQRTGQKAEDYFKQLPPSEQKERLKTGQPVKHRSEGAIMDLSKGGEIEGIRKE